MKRRKVQEDADVPVSTSQHFHDSVSSSAMTDAVAKHRDWLGGSVHRHRYFCSDAIAMFAHRSSGAGIGAARSLSLSAGVVTGIAIGTLLNSEIPAVRSKRKIPIGYSQIAGIPLN